MLNVCWLDYEQLSNEVDGTDGNYSGPERVISRSPRLWPAPPLIPAFGATMRNVTRALLVCFSCLLCASCAGQQPEQYRVLRHDFVGSLLVYFSGESDGFSVYVPVVKAKFAGYRSWTTEDGLRVDYTPYKFDWRYGPFFTGSPKRVKKLALSSGKAVLERVDGKLLFSLRDMRFGTKHYSIVGPVEVKLGTKSRP